MNRRRKYVNPSDQARKRRVLTPLVSLVDGYFENGEVLKKRGWYSFEPYWQFRQSLCSSGGWETYKKYIVESKKEALGNYRSDFIATLKANFDGEEHSALTACDREYLELRTTVAYETAWRPFREAQVELRQKEIELHATAISERITDDERSERIRIWSSVVEELGRRLGFEPKTRPPHKSYPSSFRRTLTTGWDFAVGVDVAALGSERAEMIAKPPGMGPLPIGQHITWMALLPAGKSGARPNDAESIVVPQYFVPFDGAYGNFWDFEGLEINVRASLTAIEILWPEMQARLVEGLSNFGS